MIQSEVILNFGIKDDWSECGWLTLQWMLKETIAAAYCSSCSRKDLMTVFLEQLKYLNEACVINLSGSSTVYYNFFEVRKPNKSITKFLFLQRISWLFWSSLQSCGFDSLRIGNSLGSLVSSLATVLLGQQLL